jgi:hypothetical protein
MWKKCTFNPQKPPLGQASHFVTPNGCLFHQVNLRAIFPPGMVEMAVHLFGYGSFAGILQHGRYPDEKGVPECVLEITSHLLFVIIHF